MELIRQILAVAGVLLLLGASLWWLRHRGVASMRLPGGRKRALEAVERVALSPHHSLHLVRLGGRGILLGTSPTACAVLESFDWASLDASNCGGISEVRRCAS